MKLDIYINKETNNIMEVVDGNNINCEEYEKLIPNTVDAAKEKHVPYLSLQDDNILFVQVGSVEHPMDENHYINAIYVVSDDMLYKKVLKPGEKPELTIKLNNTSNVEVFAYCNLHGLWKASL